MDPKKKIDVLKGSFESGIIGEEEYKKHKAKLEPDVEEFDKKIEEMHKEELNEEPKKSSEKALIITIAIIVMLFAAVLAFSILSKPKPKTLEELHVLNLQGKLKLEQGYVYKVAYSFVNYDNLWYTQLKSPKGTRVYSMALRYSPKDVEGIFIEGNLNTVFFDNQSEYYVTFNPTGKDFSYVALAVADFNAHMVKVFEKIPIAACDRNETEPCSIRPIVTCDNTDKLILYIKESDRFRAYYNSNCIVVEGSGLDLVKGVDRILYNLYGIMEKEEA